MVFDERFYAMLRALPALSAVASNRFYLIEVLQSAGPGPLQKYPCVAYQLESDSPIAELDGTSHRRVARFTVICFSKSIADTRAMAAGLDSLGYNVAIAEANGFDYIYSEDSSDDYEIPFEYDEKAMKSTVNSLRVIYQDDTTTTTTTTTTTAGP